MAVIKADNVAELGTGSGVGAITLGGGVPDGARTFGSVMADGDTTPTIYILDLASFRWEYCGATYDLETNTLTRGTFKSSSTGSRIDFAAGSKFVQMTPAASDIPTQDDIDAAVDDGLAMHTISAAGLATGGGALDTDPTITVPAASQAEAEAGAINTVVMTPVRVAQALLALVGGPVSERTLVTHTLSGVAALTDTTHFSATYKSYEIELINVIPVTDNVSLSFRVTQGGIAQTSGDYFYALTLIASGSATPSGGISESATSVIVASGVDNAAGNNGVSGTIKIYDPANANGKKTIHFEMDWFSETGDLTEFNGTGQFRANNTAVDGFSIFFSSGNIASGTIKVKGCL